MNLILNRNRGETKAPLRLWARETRLHWRRASADCCCCLIKAISYNVAALINYVTVPGVQFLTLSRLLALSGFSVDWQDLWGTFRRNHWTDVSETWESFVFLHGREKKVKEKNWEGKRVHCTVICSFSQIVRLAFAGRRWARQEDGQKPRKSPLH